MATASLFVDAVTSCPRCQQPIPLNGAAESLLCGSCQNVLPMPPAVWADVIGGELVEVTGFKDTEGRQSTKILSKHGLTVQMKYGRLPPRCEKCKTPFDDAKLPAAAVAGKIFCGGCGKPSTVRAAPPWLLAMQPLARFVVSETLAVLHAAPEPAVVANKPTAVHCLQCGAQVPIEGKERLFHCKHCNGQIYLPDDLWLRLHPATTREPWFVVMDLGTAIGVLATDGPNGICSLHAITLDAAGHVLLAYESDDKGDAGHESRICAIDAQGLVMWVQDGIEFSSDAALVPSPPDGTILLVDAQKHGARVLNPQGGKPLRTIGNRAADDEGSGGASPLLSVYENKGVGIDYDGTILVLREWEGDDTMTVRRFNRDGSPAPLWPTRASRSKAYSGWKQQEPVPSAPPHRDARLRVGWDGCTYFYGDGHLARYARDGRPMGIVAFDPAVVARMRAFGADRQGIGYLLFEHAQSIGDHDYPHLLRVFPDGRFQVWLGAHVPGAPFIGRYGGKMVVFPDGTLVVGDDANLRRISPAGAILWRSHDAIENESNQLESLAKDRKPKRLARDEEG